APPPAPIMAPPVVLTEPAVADDPQPIAEEEAAELDASGDGFADEEEPEASEEQSQATFDLLEPKGARVRIDGSLLKESVPIKGLSIKAGRHKMRIYVKKTRRDLIFAIDGGEHLDLTPRFKRKPK